MNTTIQEFIEHLKKMSVKTGDDSDMNEQVPTNKNLKNGTMSMADTLRIKRKEVCFTIVNRGQVWYDSLTSVQRAELLLWYNDWLKVTETLKIPDTPDWIK